jgi:3-deoxy-7-phosphoheptulonate synthase
MMIVMKKEATQQDIDHLVEKLRSVGAEAHISKGVLKTVIGAIGDKDSIRALPLEVFPGVEKVIPILKPFKLVSREFRGEDSLIKAGSVTIGGDFFTIIAGPCAVESEEQLMSTAKAVKSGGAHMLRGGAYKPRTSPYSFQGLGEEGLKMLAAAREETGLPIVTEVMDVRDLDLVAEYADVLQIGARNMQNFLLLTELGKVRKPVLLKRSFSSTVEEFLMAAEYVVTNGNPNVILCERGIRTFETYTRNTLDISAIPLIRNLSHLPVIVDPSHATGKRDLVSPLCLAALAAGAHGVLVEVHPNPEEALCDGPQSLDFASFQAMARELASLAEVMHRKV